MLQSGGITAQLEEYQFGWWGWGEEEDGLGMGPWYLPEAPEQSLGAGRMMGGTDWVSE